MKEFVFNYEQLIPAPVDEVFAFFADAQNLQRITPPALNFKILTSLPINMHAGTVIDYRLKIHGIPCHWRTLIDVWEPNKCFVDTQLKGPYKFWHHTHTFSKAGEGTLMNDTVRYVLPFGRLGLLVHPWLVRPDVEKIFAYRKKFITEKFGLPAS